MAKKHYAYMLKCADNTIYSGYAVDPYKRLQVHNSRKRCKIYKSSFTSRISIFWRIWNKNGSPT